MADKNASSNTAEVRARNLEIPGPPSAMSR